MLAIWIGIVIVASIVIMKACDSFDEASSYLGKDMPSGVKGATINAIASSIPELLTTIFLLFVFHDHDGFSAGIATCAGSAVFNAVVIPALCTGAVLIFGVKRGPAKQKVESISIDKDTVIRDGFFFICAEITLILFLGNTTMAWWMGIALVLIYLFYFSYLMVQIRNSKVKYDDWEDWDIESNAEAWVKLIASVTVIATACYFLSESVMGISEELNIPPFLSAVIFAAAATSVPDTVISVKDALKGNYDDAISNAIGSNIFDITICLGLPLLAYGLIYGDVPLSGSEVANVQILRIVLIGITVAVLGVLLFGKLGKGKAIIMGLIYIGWLGFIITLAVKESKNVGLYESRRDNKAAVPTMHVDVRRHEHWDGLAAKKIRHNWQEITAEEEWRELQSSVRLQQRREITQ